MRSIIKPSRAGFTIVELVAVITIAGLLAATVMPAMGRVGQARREAAAAEVARLLTFARERAIASGRPVGLRIDTGENAVDLVTVTEAGGVEALPSPLGQPSPAVWLEAQFGARLGRVSLTPAGGGELGGNGDAASCVWFDHRGTPHARSESGQPAGRLGDVSIEIAEVGAIRVAAWSGLVESP